MSRNKKYNDDIVLEKAMHVFWDNGYEGTSVRMLEKEMGINQFSIYSSFSNKRNLFLKSIKKYRQFVSANTFRSLLKEDARLKDLELFFSDFINEVKSGKLYKGCLVVNTTGEIGSKDSDITLELNSYYGFIKNMFKRVLANAVAAGEIPGETDLEKYSNYLLGIMQGLSVGAKVLPENQIRDFITVSLSAIR